MADPGTNTGLLIRVLEGLIAIWAVVRIPISIFDGRYLKKVEKDGTRNYVHVSDWKRLEEKLDKSLADNEKYRRLVDRWMANP